MQITVESVAQMWDDMQGLLVEHYSEIAQDKTHIPLAPNRARYEGLERDGKLLAIACRSPDGAMIGYSVFFINDHIHYDQTLFAINDVLFVTRSMRKTRAGMLLIDASEAQLKALGVKKIMWHIKPDYDWSNILTRRDYGVSETIYGKLL